MCYDRASDPAQVFPECYAATRFSKCYEATRFVKSDVLELLESLESLEMRSRKVFVMKMIWNLQLARFHQEVVIMPEAYSAILIATDPSLQIRVQCPVRVAP